MSTVIQRLIRQNENPDLIREVFEFAKEAYGEKKRTSGELYFDHATSVALILSNMELDQTTIAAGILHDVADIHNPKEKESMLVKIEKQFGREIKDVVEKVSELNKIYYFTRTNLQSGLLPEKEHTENLRKMFFAIAKDLRVILIDLASRIDGLRNISRLPEALQKTYAAETMEIFVPVANRLGLGEMKRELEDLAFAYLYPEEFKLVRENIQQKYEERQQYLRHAIPHVKKIFHKEKIPFSDINYRAKSYWSTYQKLLKKNMDFEAIHDLVALRVIVADVAACYKTLGIIHKYYKPISEEINDYIAKPKINGYKSLHTTVALEKNRITEIQIRTSQMHKEAEYGVCAHWSYKENINLQKNKEHLQWTQEVPDFFSSFTIDFYTDKIFAFTPKGDVIMLPKGSTPIDFAYAVHSDIGNHCESAKIGGHIVPLSEVLQNGDVVEIITNKKRAPSQDWLRFIKTNFAKVNIRKETLLKIPASLFSIPSIITKKIFGGAPKPQKANVVPPKKDGPKQHLQIQRAPTDAAE